MVGGAASRRFLKESFKGKGGDQKRERERGKNEEGDGKENEEGESFRDESP